MSEIAGQIYVTNSQGQRVSSKNPAVTFFLNAADGRKTRKKDDITPDELQDISTAMVLYSLQKIGDFVQQHTLLALPPSAINPYQAPGDISGDVIEVETVGDQHHLNTRMVAEDLLRLTSTQGKIKRETGKYTVVTAITDGTITQEVAMPQQEFTCTQGSVIVSAWENIHSIGTQTQAGQDVLVTSQTGSITEEPLVLKRTVTIHKEEDGGWFSSSTTTTETSTSHEALPTRTVAGHNVEKIADKAINQAGTQDVAGQELHYKASTVSIETPVLANTYSKITSKEGMFSSSTSSFSQETPFVIQALMQAPKIHIEADTGVLKGVVIHGNTLHDKTKTGLSMQPTVKEMRYRQQMTADSPLSSSDCGTEGGQEVMVPVQLLVDQVIRQIDDGEIKLVSVERDADRTQIIGKFKETAYVLKKWERSWAEHNQIVPDGVLVVVALAVTLATQGIGAKLGAALCGAETIGAGMVSAGFTTLCVSATDSFLRHGDILQTGKDLLSNRGLRSLATSVATAGLIGNGGSTASLNLGQRLVVNGARSFVRACVSSAIERRPFGKALEEGAIGALVDSVSGVLAQKIGEAAFDNRITLFEKRLAHFGVGAGMGAALSRKNAFAEAIKGGMGAVIGESIAEALVDRDQIEAEVLREMHQDGTPFTKAAYEEAYREKLRPYIDASRLMVGSIVAALGQDPTIAIATATNALENNFSECILLPEMKSLTPEVCEVVTQIVQAAGEAIMETGEDIRENPEPYAQELVLGFVPYGHIGCKLYNEEEVSKLELAIETGMVIIPGVKVANAGRKVVGKVLGKFATAFTRKMKQKIAQGGGKNPALKGGVREGIFEAPDLANVNRVGPHLPTPSSLTVVGKGQGSKDTVFATVKDVGGKVKKRPDPNVTSLPNPRGTHIPKVREKLKQGVQEHKKFAQEIKIKKKRNPKWETEKKVEYDNGKYGIIDGITPSGRPIELKPNTPSGIKKGKKQLLKYEEATGKRGIMVLYDSVTGKRTYIRTPTSKQPL